MGYPGARGCDDDSSIGGNIARPELQHPLSSRLARRSERPRDLLLPFSQLGQSPLGKLRSPTASGSKRPPSVVSTRLTAQPILHSFGTTATWFPWGTSSHEQNLAFARLQKNSTRKPILIPLGDLAAAPCRATWHPPRRPQNFQFTDNYRRLGISSRRTIRASIQYRLRRFKGENAQIWSGVLFKTSRSLPTIDVLIPKVKLFNDFLRLYPDLYSYMRMWHWQNGRSSEYSPAAIAPELVLNGVFVFLGNRTPVDALDPDVVLTAMDRFLPLYEYVESGGQDSRSQPLKKSIHFPTRTHEKTLRDEGFARPKGIGCDLAAQLIARSSLPQTGGQIRH